MSEYSEEVSKLLELGAKTYAAKEYEEAVNHYGEACQIYSNDNEGKESPELLFLYGKALFQVAVSKNGIFGGNPDEAAALATTATKDETKTDEKPTNGMFQFSEDVPLAEEEDDEESEKKDNGKEDEEQEKEQEKEEEQEEDGEEEEQQGEEQGEEEQSDFEIAWEILDLARSLYEQTLPETPLNEIPKDAENSKDPVVITKIKLSDIHDLLGEISLETENFKQASEDFESLLKIREELFPFDSSLISEAHYKLSLALEFNFADNDSKSKAIMHLTKAIESIKLKQSKQSDDEKDIDLIKDLESRLEDLQKDPNEAFDEQKKDIIKGILGEVTSADEQKPKQASSSNQAVNDLTSVVKKRKAKPNDNAAKKPKQ